MEEKTTDKNKILDSKEKKINELFNRTADEMFYDFFKKYFKIIILILIGIIISVLYGTYRYQVNVQYEERITEKIINVMNIPNNKRNSHIEKIIKEEKNLKENHKVLLLLMKNNDNDINDLLLYKEAKSLKYVCQYIFTTYHFDDLHFTTELFYLKVLYLLGKNGNIKEMKEFFMEKKMQCSIFAFYAHFILALYTKDHNILKELFVGYNSFLTNINKVLILYIKMEK